MSRRLWLVDVDDALHLIFLTQPSCDKYWISHFFSFLLFLWVLFDISVVRWLLFITVRPGNRLWKKNNKLAIYTKTGSFGWMSFIGKYGVLKLYKNHTLNWELFKKIGIWICKINNTNNSNNNSMSLFIYRLIKSASR